jgi:quercetin dioxygenase-like cupin family protein
MKLNVFIPSFFLLFVSSCSTTLNNKQAKVAQQRLPVKCIENSPERRGEEGCTILAVRPLVGPTTNELYWHIERFDSLEAAMKAAGPNGVATEAHGSFWLLTVEVKTDDHYGGHHVGWIGPIVPPATANSFLMRVQSSLLMPGSTTPVHTHSGPEVFYIVDGEQCIEMPENSQHLNSGQSYVVPGGDIHRGRVIGNKARRALALILYDAASPASNDLNNPPSLVSCK